jgi:predicted nucleotidyltransferase
MKSLEELNLQENEKSALLELKRNLLQTFPDAEIILYGSKARGDDEEFSDIDLLILIDSKVNGHLKETITEITYDMELKYDVVFGTIVENQNFWNSPLAHVMPLHQNIEREGIHI